MLGELIATVGARLLYEYDFGDGWQHELLLEEVLLGDETFQQTCVTGKRCCPPEDCGGPQGFAELHYQSARLSTHVADGTKIDPHHHGDDHEPDENCDFCCASVRTDSADRANSVTDE